MRTLRTMGLTIDLGEQKNAIQNFYNPLLIEFRHMSLLLAEFPNRMANIPLEIVYKSLKSI